MKLYSNWQRLWSILLFPVIWLLLVLEQMLASLEYFLRCYKREWSNLKAIYRAVWKNRPVEKEIDEHARCDQ
jgi:hypothetical protein